MRRRGRPRSGAAAGWNRAAAVLRSPRRRYTAEIASRYRGRETMDLVERLGRTYTGVVHDVMRAMGLRDFTLPPSIRPLSPDQVLAGVVATVCGRVDGSAGAHDRP